MILPLLLIGGQFADHLTRRLEQRRLDDSLLGGFAQVWNSKKVRKSARIAFATPELLWSVQRVTPENTIVSRGPGMASVRQIDSMYLRDLQICVSSIAAFPPGFSWDSVRGPMHAVVEGYLSQLPRRKVRLGGAAKVCIQLGPRPSVGMFSSADFGIYPDGVGWIWLPSFDFCTLARADAVGQQRLFLNAIHEGLMEFAARTQSEAEPFIRAKEAILARSLPLPELTEHELRIRWGLVPKDKKSPSRGKPSDRPSRTNQARNGQDAEQIQPTDKQESSAQDGESSAARG